MTNPQIKISLDEVNDSDVNAKPHKISKNKKILLAIAVCLALFLILYRIDHANTTHAIERVLVEASNITNNLVPSCSHCNSQKGNLTERQYKQILKAKNSESKRIRNRIIKANEYYKEKYGYCLPKEWITTKKIDNVLVTMIMNENYRGTQYNKIGIFYKEYKHLPYPIVVDRNNYLLDGFLVLIFAKNNNISKIPTIVLENVEVVFNT